MFSGVNGDLWRREGTETRAERELRMVRVRVLSKCKCTGRVKAWDSKGQISSYCHSIPAARVGKLTGRVDR